MTDDIELQKQANRGVRAKLLLENEILREAFETLEATYTKELFLTMPADNLAREKLYLAVNIVRKVQDHLNLAISNGALARADLKRLTAEIERKKRFGLL